MTDDPREILRKAGVEVPEVDALGRIPHLIIEDDNWYSCPASGECARDDAGDRCDCGADFHNAQIDAAILALSRLISQLASDKADCQEAAQRANEAAALANEDNQRLRCDVTRAEHEAENE